MNHEARGQSILLVDDDVEFLKALTKVLEKEGYQVVAQPSAGSAMEYITKSKQQFDLIITDVSMPGIRGTAFLAALKTAFPKIPVIIVTAFGDWGQYMETLREGACEYLNKPVDKSQLLDAIRRALCNGKSPALQPS